MTLESFDINIVQPSEKIVYHLDEAFWRLFEHSIVEQSKLLAEVHIISVDGGFKAVCKVQGTVVLSCDHSLEPFDYPIDLEKRTTFRVGDKYEEVDLDLYTIEAHTTAINIAQHLYEFISLAVPMRKIHPRHASLENENVGC